MLVFRKKPFEGDAVNPELSRGAVPARCWKSSAGTGRSEGAGVSRAAQHPQDGAYVAPAAWESSRILNTPLHTLALGRAGQSLSCAPCHLGGGI